MSSRLLHKRLQMPSVSRVFDKYLGPWFMEHASPWAEQYALPDYPYPSIAFL
jgi:hypothetical protein